jgi:hypothetical protein
MSVNDYIPKDKEPIKCPINTAAYGRMVGGQMYRRPSIIAWREAVSNACDALRHFEHKEIRIYTNVRGDGVIEDWGTGIQDSEHFNQFIGIGRIKEDRGEDINKRDDREIGRFGLGKNSFLSLSKIKTVQFYSHGEKAGIKRGMIVTLVQHENGDILYYPPDTLDSKQAVEHRGMRVIIRQLNKPISTNRLIEHVGRWFFLKIARGYKIFVDDIQVHKPENFKTDHQETLFRLDNGCEVYGQLEYIDKPKPENLDILVNQVNIQRMDFQRKVEGWVDCDELELTTTREGISNEESTVFPDFHEKLEKYLEKFDPRDVPKQRSINSKRWEEVATAAIVRYFKHFREDTLPFTKGLPTNLGLQGRGISLKGKDIWKDRKNSKLEKVEGEKGEQQVKQRRKKGERRNNEKKDEKKRTKRGPSRSTNNGTTGNKYDVVYGKGLVAIKEKSENEEEDEIKPQVGFDQIPTNMEDPLCYWMRDKEKFAINTIHDGWKMFENPNSDGARNETFRAIIKAVPENNGIPVEEFDKKYYTLLDMMSAEEA